MPGRGRPRKFNEEEAIEAAMHLFWQEGYNSTSCEQLSAAMGVGNSSFFSTFKDKESLFNRAVGLYAESVFAHAMSKMEDAENPLEGVRDVVRMWEGYYGSPKGCRGCLAAIALLETDDEHPARATVDAMVSRFKRRVKKSLDEAKERGDLPEDYDTKSTAAFMVSTFQGLSAMARGGAAAPELRGAAATCMRVLS